MCADCGEAASERRVHYAEIEAALAINLMNEALEEVYMVFTHIYTG